LASKQKQFNRMIFYSILILLLALSWRTVKRNNDWMDEEHLYRSGIEINPAKGISSTRCFFEFNVQCNTE
jgi:hypothetical protein